LAALALPAFAQQRSNIPVVGILSGRSRAAAIDTGVQDAFLRGMRELGYVEGRNIRYEYRYAGGRYDDLRRYAEELVRLKVDVIVGTGASAIAPAKDATSTIPIVMTNASDPVGSGFVASLARPGGNVTGLSSIAVEATPKRLELLVTTIPGLHRVALLTNPNNRATKFFVREVHAAAPRFKLHIVSVQAGTAEEIEAAFSLMMREKVQAFVPASDSLFINQRHQIVGLAAKSRLPAVFPNREYFAAGGLMAYGIDTADMHRRAATYVDKILKGAKPGDLPVEQPDKFELLVNLKTAQELGVTIPYALVMRANEVVR
jgi:putative ABC transport system substrate-binding protein